jgi:hypothetical protein
MTAGIASVLESVMESEVVSQMVLGTLLEMELELGMASETKLIGQVHFEQLHDV